MRWVMFVSCVLWLSLTALAIGGRSKDKLNEPPAIDQEVGILPAGEIPSGSSILESSSTITWVIVDSMSNAFGTGGWNMKPIAYDSATNSIAIIHRGHAGYGNSGQLFYNMSRNGGSNWRRVSELNGGNPYLSRYPGCAIYNPTNSTDTSNVLFTFAAPQLLTGGAAFGNAIYGADFLGLGSGFSIVDAANGALWSNLLIWTGKGTDGIYWTAYTGATQSDYLLWRTNDYSTINQGIPPIWESTNFQPGVARRDISGKYRNGKSYFSMYGVWPPPDPGVVYNLGYSTSTNNGATWSSWSFPQPDWRSIPGLGLNYDLWSYGGPNNFSFDMLVDGNNRVHFFYVVEDTLTFERSLVEIFETGSGWNSKIVKVGLQQSTILQYPGAATLNQMGNHINAAISGDGTVMALYWLDGNGVSTDSLPDIWTSHRHISGNWSAPENLTQTPSVAEIMLHCAPDLRSNGGNSYTAFLGRTYQIGLNTWPPISESPSYFYFGTSTFSQGTVSVEPQQGTPGAFRLHQNFPNPFNPITRIVYELPVSSHVNLAVYNMLGEQVAILADGVKEAGTYDVEFSGSGLSSGVYFYTIKAGQFVETRKLLLVK